MPKNTLIITALVVAVIVIGVTAVFTIQRQVSKEVKRREEVATTTERPIVESQPEEPTVQPEEPTTTEPIDTSDWKVYRNEKYGYEVKYPVDPLPQWAERRIWKKENIKYPYLETVVILLPFLIPSSFLPPEIKSEFPTGLMVGETYLEISIAENPNQVSLKEWIHQFVGRRYEIEDFALGKLKGVMIPLVYLPEAGGCETYYFSKRFKIYSVGFCQYEAWYSPKPEDGGFNKKMLD